MRWPVPHARDLGEKASRALRLPDGRAAFVVRHEGRLYAYENRCPHWGVDLDFGTEDFVDTRTGHVFCRNHAAEFLCETGVCVRGPCAGQRLEPLTLEEVGDEVYVLLDE